MFNISKDNHKTLLSYITIYQKPISESLQECGLNPPIHKDDPLDDLLVLAKKHINVFPFSDVKPCWFQLFATVCLAKAAFSLKGLDVSRPIDDEGNDRVLSEVVADLDNALIIAGGGDEETREVIQGVFRRLDWIFYPDDQSDNEDDDCDNDEPDIDDIRPPPNKKRRLNTTTTQTTISSTDALPKDLIFTPRITQPILRLSSPSLEHFTSHVHTINTPLILSETLTHWPALTKWPSKSYWLRRTLNGHRLVPIELGQSYTDDDWSQEIMTFRRFLSEFILRGDEAECVGYLAQHDLGGQVEGLRGDIGVPEYCFVDIPRENGKGHETGMAGLTDDGGGGSSLPVNASGGPSYDQAHKSQFTDPEINDPIDGKTTAASSRTRPQHTTTSTPTTHPPTRNSSPPPIPSPPHQLPHQASQSAPSPSSASTTQPPPTIHQNIWFGTRTVTPLHHDPYSNILTQIHGTKYIRLYDPIYTANLYPRSTHETAPHVPISTTSPDSSFATSPSALLPTASTNPPQTDTINMSNTSTIPLWSIEQSPHEDWDALYPGFSTVPYVEGLLHEGDALYIPRGWWHYVRGVSATGISVSFWW